MKRLIIVVCLFIFIVSCCTNCDTIQSTDSSPNNNYYQPFTAPLTLSSFDEIAIEKNKLRESGNQLDEYKIKDLEYIYIPSKLLYHFDVKLESIVTASSFWPEYAG